MYRWAFWARPGQTPPPGMYRVWLMLAGRGFGKTRAGSEATRAASSRFPHTTLVGPTWDHVRDVMVEGPAGILACCPPDERPVFRPGLKRIDWPNGHKTRCYSADRPDRLRGPQHQWAWAEEVAAWRYEEAWDQLAFGVRLPPDPRIVVTTTPKPTRVIREMVDSPETHVTTGTSYENRANLDPAWYDGLIAKYEGTRLGRQELLAEILTDVPGALWTNATIGEHAQAPDPGDLVSVVIGLDPHDGGDDDDGAEMGIILAGKGYDGLGYVLGDYTFRGSPGEVTERVASIAQEWMVDAIVVETNHGGHWIKATMETKLRGRFRIREVTASRGKRTRAEPIAAQYEQGKWRHTPVQEPVEGWRGAVRPLADLEDQMRTWVPDTGEPSPDRMDALVWAATALDVRGKPTRRRKKDAPDDDRAGRPETAGMMNREY